MIPAPGQGFKTGLDIQFIAIPYPLPVEQQSSLVAAGDRARLARKEVDLCKDGANAKRSIAEEKYRQAIIDLELTEISIRHAEGVVHTRPIFLPYGSKK